MTERVPLGNERGLLPRTLPGKQPTALGTSLGTYRLGQALKSQSGRQDSNLRPSAPKALGESPQGRTGDQGRGYGGQGLHHHPHGQPR